MPNYGFGVTALGAGAQEGLEALLRRRLQERQMALAEQAQRENSAYRERELSMRQGELDDSRQFQRMMQIAALDDRRTKMAFDAGEAVSEQTPVGSDVPDAVRGTPAAARIRAIPMSGMDTEGNPAKPLEFMGFSAKEREAEDRQQERLLLQKQADQNRDEDREDRQRFAATLASAYRRTPDEMGWQVQTIKQPDGSFKTVRVNPNTKAVEDFDLGGTVATTDDRNKTTARGLVSKSIKPLEELSQNIITRIGPRQRLEAAKRGVDAVFGNDPLFRAYQDARMSLAGNLAVGQQGSRPSDADIKAIWLPMVPDAFSDTAESAQMKWYLIKVMSGQQAGENPMDALAAKTQGVQSKTTKVPLSSLGK